MRPPLETIILFAGIAAAAPVLSALFGRAARVPIVVFEIVLGILLGPAVLGWIDLYLIHWPIPSADRYVETWRTLETFAEHGRARSIGVSNFLIPHLERLIAETGTVPAVNQVELHPVFSQPELRRFHEQHGILTEAWGPLGQGKYDLFGMAPVRDAAAAHGVAPAQVVLRWHLQLGNIIIPKSSSRERMAQNVDITGFELNDDEMAALDALNEDRRVGGNPEEVS